MRPFRGTFLLRSGSPLTLRLAVLPRPQDRVAPCAHRSGATPFPPQPLPCQAALGADQCPWDGTWEASTLSSLKSQSRHCTGCRRGRRPALRPRWVTSRPCNQTKVI